jgi:hypothetical protein
MRRPNGMVYFGNRNVNHIFPAAPREILTMVIDMYAAGHGDIESYLHS